MKIVLTDSAPPAGNRPANSHTPWSEAEDEILLLELEAGLPITKIAFLHDRSRAAIESRRERVVNNRIRLPVEIRNTIRERDHYRCRYCNTPVSPDLYGSDIDHV